ncbi:MAG: M56 family metallopeptidase, partial [Gammaproteobacteria bacterium]
MNSLQTLLQNPVVDRLGWTLLHFLWQGILAAILAGFVFHRLRRASSNARYGFGLLAMCALAVCPMITFWSIGPNSPAPLERGIPIVAADVAPSLHPTANDETGIPQSTFSVPTDVPRRIATAAPRRDSQVVPATSSVRSQTGWLPLLLLEGLHAVLPGLVGTWLVGVVVLSIRMVGGWIVLRNLKRHGTRASDPRLYSMMSRLCERMDISRVVELIESAAVRVPSVYGWIRPVILLPACAATGLGPRELESVLAHELAHIRRFDYLVNLFQVLIETLLFYHPAVWWLSKRIRQERENCCDDLAVDVVGDRMTYVRALTNVAAIGVEHPQLATAANGGELTDRIRRLMGVRAHDSAAQPRGLAGAVLLFLFVAGLAGLTIRPGGLVAEDAPSEKTQNRDAATVDEPSKKQNDASPAPDRKPADGETSRAQASALPANTGPKVTASGTVVDVNGKPMPGVKVYLREWSTYRISEEPYNRNPHDAFASRVTDENGRFRFQDVASPVFRLFDTVPNPWDVVAVADGYGVAWRHLPKADNEEPLSLTLGAESTVSGRIVDENERPIAGAHIRVQGISSLDDRIWGTREDPWHLDLQLSELSPKASTDAAGRFSIRGLPSNIRIVLSVEHEQFERDYAYAATTAEPQPDLEGYMTVSADGKQTRTMHKVYTGDLKLVLKPGRRIDGQIVFSDSDEPCPQARVSLTWDNRWNYTIADGNGRFTFYGKPDATFKVSGNPVDSDRYVAGSAEVSFEDGQRQAEVTVRLPRGQTVSGIVVAEDTGKGVPGVEVRFRSTPSSRSTDFTTGPDGKFRLLVKPGEGTVTILGPVADYFVVNRYLMQTKDSELQLQFANRFRRQVDVKATQALEGLSFSVGRGVVIHGHVRDAEGR